MHEKRMDVGAHDCEAHLHLRAGSTKEKLPLDNDLKKLTEASKQQGVLTIFGDPKALEQVYAALNPKRPHSPGPHPHPPLKPRNLNATPRKPGLPGSISSPADAAAHHLVPLPSGHKPPDSHQHDPDPIWWQPKPRFGSRSRSPESAEAALSDGSPPKAGMGCTGAHIVLSKKAAVTPSSAKKPKLEPLPRSAHARETEPGSRTPLLGPCTSVSALPALVHGHPAPPAHELRDCYAADQEQMLSLLQQRERRAEESGEPLAWEGEQMSGDGMEEESGGASTEEREARSWNSRPSSSDEQ